MILGIFFFGVGIFLIMWMVVLKVVKLYVVWIRLMN